MMTRKGRLVDNSPVSDRNPAGVHPVPQGIHRFGIDIARCILDRYTGDRNKSNPGGGNRQAKSDGTAQHDRCSCRAKKANKGSFMHIPTHPFLYICP